MSHEQITFGTIITCMDGRPNEYVINFLKNLFGVDKIDEITAPGADSFYLGNDRNAAFNSWASGELAKFNGRVSKDDLQTVVTDLARFMVVNVSVIGHGSRKIGVVGHGNHCAGNPVENEQHLKDIMDTVELVRSWIPDDLKEEVAVYPVFADSEDGKTWDVDVREAA